MDTVSDVEQILQKKKLEKSDIVTLLQSEGETERMLFQEASRIKHSIGGNKVYLRGLIEYSNICRKNCYYCGLRKGNTSIPRYELSSHEVIEAAVEANNHNFGSLVIQSGSVVILICQ